MKFGTSYRTRRYMRLEMTAMIDIVFLLIIFFMVTATFQEQTREDVNLPDEAGAQEASPNESGLVINLTEDGTLIVTGERVVLDDLESVIDQEMHAQGTAEVRVMLRADENADSTVLNDVIDELQRLGVAAAGVATEIPG